MRRLLAGTVVIGLVVAGCGSSGAHGGARGVAAADAVKATPGLKRMLAREIAHLRQAQPKAPHPFSIPRPLTVPRATVAPGGGACFIARCSETPCREFAAAPAVYRAPLLYLPGGRVVGPGGRAVGPGGRAVVPKRGVAVRGRSRTRACLPAPRKLVLVSARR